MDRFVVKTELQWVCGRGIKNLGPEVRGKACLSGEDSYFRNTREIPTRRLDGKWFVVWNSLRDVVSLSCNPAALS